MIKDKQGNPIQAFVAREELTIPPQSLAGTLALSSLFDLSDVIAVLIRSDADITRYFNNNTTDTRTVIANTDTIVMLDEDVTELTLSGTATVEIEVMSGPRHKNVDNSSDSAYIFKTDFRRALHTPRLLTDGEVLSGINDGIVSGSMTIRNGGNTYGYIAIENGALIRYNDDDYDKVAYSQDLTSAIFKQTGRVFKWEHINLYSSRDYTYVGIHDSNTSNGTSTSNVLFLSKHDEPGTPTHKITLRYSGASVNIFTSRKAANNKGALVIEDKGSGNYECYVFFQSPGGQWELEYAGPIDIGEWESTFGTDAYAFMTLDNDRAKGGIKDFAVPTALYPELIAPVHTSAFDTFTPNNPADWSLTSSSATYTGTSGESYATLGGFDFPSMTVTANLTQGQVVSGVPGDMVGLSLQSTDGSPGSGLLLKPTAFSGTDITQYTLFWNGASIITLNDLFAGGATHSVSITITDGRVHARVNTTAGDTSYGVPDITSSMDKVSVYGAFGTSAGTALVTNLQVHNCKNPIYKELDNV